VSAPVPQAVLFDVDGTLYRQAPVRALMAAELTVVPWATHRLDAPAVWRTLRTFRRVREELRTIGAGAESLDRLQYRTAASRAGVEPRFVEGLVGEWMIRRPLRYVRLARRADLIETLAALRERGVRVGVFSDYPTREKVDALGLSSWTDLQVCATDEAVNAFKPHPRGFLHACERWGVPPDRVVYVGDRADVDAAGASRAGMRCILIGARAGGGAASCTTVQSMRSVFHAIVGSGSAAPAALIG
jgi:HAD superfamily hydrolase (TIGR01549 family)